MQCKYCDAADLEFRYQEKSEVLSLAPALASNLNFYPEPHVVSVGSLFDSIDAADLASMRGYMRTLTPDRSVNILRSQVLSRLVFFYSFTPIYIKF